MHLGTIGQSAEVLHYLPSLNKCEWSMRGGDKRSRISILFKNPQLLSVLRFIYYLSNLEGFPGDMQYHLSVSVLLRRLLKYMID